MQPLEVVGTIVMMVLMSLCTMAGVGGGGVTVPLILVFFNFELKRCTAISGASILACSAARYIVNFKQKHPEKDSVSIDYSLAAVMLPAVIVGSFLGVYLSAIMPDIVITGILTLLLVFLTF